MIDLDELIAEARDRAAHMKLLAKITENSPGAAVAVEEADRMTRFADALESVRAERDAALARIAELEDRNQHLLSQFNGLKLVNERNALEARIAEAAKLHQPQPGQGVRYCADCDQRWPCPTAVVLGLNEGDNDD